MTSSPLPTRAFWLALLALLVTLPEARAQSATILGWRDATERSILDRVHNTGGIYFDRGLWRRYTSGMDDEYPLDEFTHRPPPVEMARLYDLSELGTAYYGWMGSVDRMRFATGHRLQTWKQLTGRTAVDFEMHVEESFRRRSGYFSLGVDVLLDPIEQPEGLRVGFKQTFMQYKPDLDLTLHATAGTRPTGRAEVQVHLLDVANNLIFETLGVGQRVSDTTRVYDRKPRGFSLALTSPPQRAGAWTLRAETVAGLSTRSRATVVRQNVPFTSFRWSDEAHYLGGLLEAQRRLGSVGLAVGLVGRMRYSAIARDSLSGGDAPSQYASRQREQSGGAYALAEWRVFEGEAWIEHGSYSDRQTGDDFSASTIDQSLDYLERTTWTRLRLSYAPSLGLRVDLRYLGQRRAFVRDREVLQQLFTFAQTPEAFQHRLSLGIGFGFREDAWFTIGTNLDLDGDTLVGEEPSYFDGAYGHVVMNL